LLIPQQIPAQISQMCFSLPLAGKQHAPPMKQTPHQEETAEIKTATAMSFYNGSGSLFLKDKHINHHSLSIPEQLRASYLILLWWCHLAQSSLGQMAPTFPLGDFKNIRYGLHT
jgi:hypothetical protein